MHCAAVRALVLVVLIGCNAASPPTAAPGVDGATGDRAAGGAGGGTGSGGTIADANTDQPSDGNEPSGGGGGGAGGAAGGTGGADRDGAADNNAGSDATGAACPAGALLCDNFEKYPVGSNLAPDWQTMVSGGTVAVDTTKGFGGGKSLHMTTMAAGASRSAVITKDGAPLFPVPGNAFYGRMMMWLNQMPTGGVHWNHVQASGPLPGSTRIAKFGFGGMFARLMSGYVVREGGQIRIDCSSDAPTGIPEKRWVCVEWHYDGANDEMHHWFDGQPLTAIDVVKKGKTCVGGQAPADGLWHSPMFSSLIIGWQHYQSTPIAVEAWIDDLVLASQRIGCPPPS